MAVIAAPGAIVGNLLRGAGSHAARVTDDFGLFYHASGCLASGSCDPYLVDATHAPNMNPPHAHLLFRPLLLVPPSTAFLIWISVSACVVILCGVRLARSLALNISPTWWVVGSIGLLVSAISASTLASGQIYAVLLWPVNEAWLAARRGRWTRAAAWLTVVATIKPLLLLPLAWIVWRQPRTLRIITVTAAAVFGAGVLLYGVDPYVWIHSLGLARWSGHYWDGSFLQTLTRLFLPTAFFAPIFSGTTAIVAVLWVVLTLLLVLDLVRWLPRASIDAAWLGLIAASFLITPKGWLYAGWWLLGPAVALNHRAHWRQPALLLAAGALLLPNTNTILGQPNPWLTPLLGSLYCWTWILFYLTARLSEPSIHAVSANNRDVPSWTDDPLKR